MSTNLEPKKGDRIEKTITPDIKKDNSSFNAPPKPQAPHKPESNPKNPKK
jgi:hypothetical protein